MTTVGLLHLVIASGAKQSSARGKSWIASSLALLAMTKLIHPECGRAPALRRAPPRRIDAGQRPRTRLVLFELHATCDLDALRLRRAGAVETFGQIADGVAADRHVFDQAENAHAIDNFDAVAALQKLADQGADFVVLQIFLGRHGHDETAGYVLRQPGDLVGKTGDIVLGH